MKLPRIALFSDSYHEANGIARTAVAIEACARRRNIPLLSVHPGPETRLVHDGSIVRLDLARSGLCSFGLEHGLRFDPAMWRHAGGRPCASEGPRNVRRAHPVNSPYRQKLPAVQVSDTGPSQWACIIAACTSQPSSKHSRESRPSSPRCRGCG